MPSRWSHFIRGFPLVLVLAVSWSRSSFACLRSNTVNTPSRHSLENEKKVCILTACLKTLTSSNGFPCTVLRLWGQTKVRHLVIKNNFTQWGLVNGKRAVFSKEWGQWEKQYRISVKVLITLGSHREHISHGYAITNLVSVSAYPKSSADSTASVHTMSVFTKCPISLCAAPRVLMHSVLPHPLGPIIHTWEKKAGVFIVPLNISSRNRHCMPLTSSEHKKKMLVGPYLLSIDISLDV